MSSFISTVNRLAYSSSKIRDVRDETQSADKITSYFLYNDTVRSRPVQILIRVLNKFAQIFFGAKSITHENFSNCLRRGLIYINSQAFKSISIADLEATLVTLDEINSSDKFYGYLNSPKGKNDKDRLNKIYTAIYEALTERLECGYSNEKLNQLSITDLAANLAALDALEQNPKFNEYLSTKGKNSEQLFKNINIEVYGVINGHLEENYKLNQLSITNLTANLSTLDALEENSKFNEYLSTKGKNSKQLFEDTYIKVYGVITGHFNENCSAAQLNQLPVTDLAATLAILDTLENNYKYKDYLNCQNSKQIFTNIYTNVYNSINKRLEENYSDEKLTKLSITDLTATLATLNLLENLNILEKSNKGIQTKRYLNKIYSTVYSAINNCLNNNYSNEKLTKLSITDLTATLATLNILEKSNKFKEYLNSNKGVNTKQNLEKVCSTVYNAINKCLKEKYSDEKIKKLLITDLTATLAILDTLEKSDKFNKYLNSDEGINAKQRFNRICSTVCEAVIKNLEDNYSNEKIKNLPFFYLNPILERLDTIGNSDQFKKYIGNYKNAQQSFENIYINIYNIIDDHLKENYSDEKLNTLQATDLVVSFTTLNTIEKINKFNEYLSDTGENVKQRFENIYIKLYQTINKKFEAIISDKRSQVTELEAILNTLEKINNSNKFTELPITELKTTLAILNTIGNRDDFKEHLNSNQCKQRFKEIYSAVYKAINNHLKIIYSNKELSIIDLEATLAALNEIINSNRLKELSITDLEATLENFTAIEENEQFNQYLSDKGEKVEQYFENLYSAVYEAIIKHLEENYSDEKLKVLKINEFNEPIVPDLEAILAILDKINNDTKFTKYLASNKDAKPHFEQTLNAIKVMVDTCKSQASKEKDSEEFTLLQVLSELPPLDKVPSHTNIKESKQEDVTSGSKAIHTNK